MTPDPQGHDPRKAPPMQNEEGRFGAATDEQKRAGQ